MYVFPNYRTKKELIEALTKGKFVEAMQPFPGDVPTDGTVYLEGPHYPQPHRWYAQGRMENGKLVEVK